MRCTNWSVAALQLDVQRRQRRETLYVQNLGVETLSAAYDVESWQDLYMILR